MKLTKYIKLIIFSTLALIAFACQEPYFADDALPTRTIPVIEGEITDAPGPYKVTLTWAKPFAARYSNSLDYIRNAVVYIYDDAGNKEQLFEKSYTGVYFTKANGIRGTIGRTYHLSIKLGNGFLYSSIPTKLEEPKLIDSIYAESGTYDYGIVDGAGDFVRKSYKGIYIYADINCGNVNTKYYKFSNWIVWQTTRIFTPPGAAGSTIIYYRQIQYPDFYPDVKSSILFGNNQQIKKHLLTFIPYIQDPYPMGIDSLYLSAYENQGWIITTQLNSISREVHDYYSSVSEQMKAGSQLFDPIPKEISGNIRCKSDTTQIALGIFNVYTKSIKSKGFYWSPFSKTVRSKFVSDPGPAWSDTTSGTAPSYWYVYNN
jgi:hypothetical protein